MRVEIWTCDRCEAVLERPLLKGESPDASGCRNAPDVRAEIRSGVSSFATDLCQTCLDGAIAYLFPEASKRRAAIVAEFKRYRPADPFPLALRVYGPSVNR